MRKPAECLNWGSRMVLVPAHCSRIFGFTEGPVSCPTVERAARALAAWFGGSRRANDQPLHRPASWLP